MANFFLFSIAIFGSIFGSFASALIPRLREGRNMSRERSQCPNCHHVLSAWDLFPILSYVGLGGKCRFCRKPIPAYHFALEVSMTAAFVLVGYFLVDPNLVFAGNGAELGRLAFFLASAFVAVTFTFYDLLYMEIPDEVVLPFLVGAFALLCADGFFGWGVFSHFLPFESPVFSLPVANALLGSMAIFAFFLVQILVSKWAWMGGGDLRVAVFMGFVAGAKIAWLGLFLAYLTGSVVGLAIMAARPGKNTMIPFGPALAIGLFLALFFHEGILDWYFSLATNGI